LPSVFFFAEGYLSPTKSTRQRAVCRLNLSRVGFVEGGTWQTFCWVFFRLCRVPVVSPCVHTLLNYNNL
jgi:hypothetical protein